MPNSVQREIGGTWEGGPFGPIPDCPSAPKVLQIGVAVDAGFVKVRCFELSGGSGTGGRHEDVFENEKLHPD